MSRVNPSGVVIGDHRAKAEEWDRVKDQAARLVERFPLGKARRARGNKDELFATDPADGVAREARNYDSTIAILTAS